MQKMQERDKENAASGKDDPQSELDFGGRKRTYLVHVPKSYDGKSAVPLVIVFHGGGGRAQGAVRMSNMDSKAEKENFIVVYPNGTGKIDGVFLTWNTWQCCGYALDQNVDDVGFVRALVEKVAQQYHVDRKRIFATGMSNGGMMTYRVGCELSDIFAAIAPVAGALDTDSFNPAQPVSVIIFHGTADMHVLYDGGAPKKTVDTAHHRVDKPVSYAVNSWVRRDHCNPKPIRTKTGHIIHDVYSGGEKGTAVELYSIEGQGHAWPGSVRVEGGERRRMADTPTTEISATDLMWKFFTEHPKQ